MPYWIDLFIILVWTARKLVNWQVEVGRYNLKSVGKPVIDCTLSALVKVNDRSLISYVRARTHNKTIKLLFLEEPNKDADGANRQVKVNELFDYYV